MCRNKHQHLNKQTTQEVETTKKLLGTRYIKVDKHGIKELRETRRNTTHLEYMYMTQHHTMSHKKEATILLPLTVPCADGFSRSFTGRLSSKFAVTRSLKIPPHLK